MKYYEKKVLVALLDLASDRFSNHGCNDFDLQEVLPEQSDRQMFVKDMYADSGDEERYQEELKYSPNFRYDNDSGLMEYFANRFTHEIAKARGEMYEALVMGLRSSYEDEKRAALAQLASAFGYEEERDAFVTETKQPDPADTLGMYLYLGLQARTTTYMQYYLEQVRLHEGFAMPFDYDVPVRKEDGIIRYE